MNKDPGKELMRQTLKLEADIVVFERANIIEFKRKFDVEQTLMDVGNGGIAEKVETKEKSLEALSEQILYLQSACAIIENIVYSSENNPVKAFLLMIDQNKLKQIAICCSVLQEEINKKTKHLRLINNISDEEFIDIMKKGKCE